MDPEAFRTARELRTDGGSCVVPSLDPDAGIEVGHMATGDHDVYGGRSRRGDVLAHMANTNPPAPGWLGNPHTVDGDDRESRREAIRRYTEDFLARVRSDDDFLAAVEGLRGQRVACWCRGVTVDRTPDNWCHLDVVAAWLDGDLAPVYRYLRGEDDE